MEENFINNISSTEGELSLITTADIVLLPIFIIFIISGVFGNCLVCLAIYLNRDLHSTTNYFLLSLALADLLVCTVVMPFGAATFITGSWSMSTFWCIFYQTCDVLACSVSILHLMFISIGRYRGIRRPLHNRAQSGDHVLYKVSLTWGLGLLLASPIPVLAILNINHNMPAPDRCELNNVYFLVIGSLLSFYIPMLIMVTTYILTVLHLNKQKRGSLAANRHVGISSLVAATVGATAPGMGLPPGPCMAGIATTTTSTRCCRKYCSRGTQTGKDTKTQVCSHPQPQYPQVRSRSIFAALPFAPRSLVPSQTVSEEKASRVLGVVFSAFVVCWAPFFVLNLVVGLCGDLCSPPPFFFEMALWLGYASSTINPLIYTVFNVKFRRSFVRLLVCRRGYYTNSSRNSSNSF